MQAKPKKRVGKIILISFLIFLLFFVAVSCVGVKFTYDDNFGRAEAPEFTAYLRYADVEDSYARSTVTFTSGKNTLAGYVYGEENTKGLVVVVHGLGGGAESYTPEILHFVNEGWRVFSYDATGSHQSEGEGTGGLPQSALDLDAALTYIANQTQFSGLLIMLYGHSWGGFAVTAVLNMGHKVAAVASIAGYNSPTELLFEQAKSMMGSLAYVEYPFLWGYQKLLYGSYTGLTAVDGINASNAPVLVVHGSEDETISYSGSSIIAHQDEITNPYVVYKTCSTPGQNGHSSLFKSAQNIAYTEEKNLEYKALYQQYDGQIPTNVKAEYYAGVDKALASELDPAFMAEVNQFFVQALGA